MAAAAAGAEAVAARLAATARGAGGADWAGRCAAALELARLFREHEREVLAEVRPDVPADELRKRLARDGLTFARWLFTPDDVVREVLGRTRSSRAVIQPLPESPEFADEAARALAALPQWERAIASKLAQSPRAFWIARPDDGLVTSPPDTVVLTVRPPGSDLEIEIKRTGRPAPRPLSVVWERGGACVPPTHRLDGGSTWEPLRFEAAASARFAQVWRAIHGEEAPISRTISIKAVYALPDGDREVPVLDYFAEEASRGAMEQAVRAFCREAEREPPPMRSDMAVAAQFLLHASPAQSILIGTSAHRLDRITDRDAVLVDARTDHRHATSRLGAIWGTFLALAAGSNGESVVARNVGLRTAFRDGDWRVELVSMDHDNLQIARADDVSFGPAYILGANVKDEIALFGGTYKGARVRGSLELLADIYGVARDTTHAIFFEAARAAFVRCENPPDGVFTPAFLGQLRRWHQAVRRFLSGSRLRTYRAIEQNPDFLRRHAAVWMGA